MCRLDDGNDDHFDDGCEHTLMPCAVGVGRVEVEGRSRPRAFEEALGARGGAAGVEVASTSKRRRQSRWDFGPADPAPASTVTARAGADVDECVAGASDYFSGGGPVVVREPSKQAVVASDIIETATSPVSGASPKRVYVGNLSYRLTELDVRSLFQLVGDIQQVAMPVDPLLGRHRGRAVQVAPVKPRSRAPETQRLKLTLETAFEFCFRRYHAGSRLLSSPPPAPRRTRCVWTACSSQTGDCSCVRVAARRGVLACVCPFASPSFRLPASSPCLFLFLPSSSCPPLSPLRCAA